MTLFYQAVINVTHNMCHLNRNILEINLKFFVAIIFFYFFLLLLNEHLRFSN